MPRVRAMGNGTEYMEKVCNNSPVNPVMKASYMMNAGLEHVTVERRKGYESRNEIQQPNRITTARTTGIGKTWPL